MTRPAPARPAARPAQASRESLRPAARPSGARLCPTRDGHLAGAWSALIRARCTRREEAAYLFGVTHQSACNWWEAVTAPSARAVLRAWALWGEGVLAELEAAA